MKDLAYLTGWVFTSFNDYRLRNVDKKKTKDEIVSRILFFLWKRNQRNIAAKLWI